MIPSGKAHNEMLLGEDVPDAEIEQAIDAEGQGAGLRDECQEHERHIDSRPARPISSTDRKEPIETHTLSVVVDNEPGVLARVIGLFSGRGYNIESLTVSETEHETHVSRITIVTTRHARGARSRSSTSSSAWCRCIRSPT